MFQCFQTESNDEEFKRIITTVLSGKRKETIISSMKSCRESSDILKNSKNLSKDLIYFYLNHSYVHIKNTNDIYGIDELIEDLHNTKKLVFKI